MTSRCLVVDDEQTSRMILSGIMQDMSFDVDEAEDAKQMRQRLAEQRYEIIFLDYRLGDVNGLEELPQLIEEYPRSKVIMITAHGSIELATQSLHLGASGFIAKPLSPEPVKTEVHRALKHQVPPGDQAGSESGIIGVSPAVKRIHDQIHKMKDVETTVLVTGESGTGKELIARALHHLSTRKDEKFAAINCAAIPETLLEAELFGYKKGAFTDAKQDRVGLFEACSKGTLFLDELGEMPLQLQTKLLRVLQEKTITPLGSTHPVTVNTRVVAATNRNLQELVQKNEFRKDLYYRLSILEIESPPLRDRSEDIPELVDHFVHRIAKRLNKSVGKVSANLMARLQAYDWPGNIRELQNALERAMVLAEGQELKAEDIFHGHEMTGEPSLETMLEPEDFQPLTEAKDTFEKDYIERLLKATGGNVSQASKIAGRTRTDMYRLFAKYDIDPQDFK